MNVKYRGPEGFFPGVKGSVRELSTHHLLPGLRTPGAIVPASYIFLTCCLIKRRYNFTVCTTDAVCSHKIQCRCCACSCNLSVPAACPIFRYLVTLTRGEEYTDYEAVYNVDLSSADGRLEYSAVLCGGEFQTHGP